MNRFEFRTFIVMLVVSLLAAASAFYTFASTAGVRGDTTVRPLVWTIFAVPLALFVSWVFVRRREGWLAAFSSLCLYFFTPFVSARIETIIDPVEAAIIGGRHNTYFITVIVLHVLAGAAIAFWRARTPEAPPTSAPIDVAPRSQA